MAKRFCTLIPLLLLCWLPSKAQTGFDTLHNFSNNPSFIYSFIGSTLADSNQFITAGVTANSSGQYIHTYLSAFDYEAKLLWQSDLLFPGDENSVSGNYIIARQNNGTYVVGGEQLDFRINPKITVHQPFLYFFNKHGDSLGFAKYTDSFISRDVTSLTTDSEQNVIVTGVVTGNSLSFDTYYGDYSYDSIATWVAKFNKNGVLLWEKKFFWSTQNETVDKIVVSTDAQHYIIGGYLYDSASGCNQSFLLKTDTAGNEVWRKYIPRKFLNPVGDFAIPFDDIDIIAAKGDGYYFSGTYIEFNAAPHYIPCSRFYYGKMDEDGDTLWTKSYGNDSGIASTSIGINIAYSSDGNLLMTGNNNYTDAYMPVLFKADTLGNVLWFREQLRGGSKVPVLEMAQQSLSTLSVAPDGRILTCGTLFNPYHPLTYFDTVGLISRMVLTDTSGQRFSGDTVMYNVGQYLDGENVTAVSTPSPDIQVYPNPVSDVVFIKYTNVSSGAFSICDMLGRVIVQEQIHEDNGTIKLDFPYPPGIYLYKFSVQDVIKAGGKIMKE
ncbi:MAG TPA: T9SS type A sorting domain-containing protein [Flavipsychrobacter sp.]|nr:T9SS type A sorting domain-containing protein [Flavipsychrobacter sp.]